MTESLCLTTNNCESFHSHFNQQFYKSGTTISIFIKILIENVQFRINKSTLLKFTGTSKAITLF